MRLFIGINITKKQRTRIHRVARVLRERDLPIRWIDPDKFHITLKFLGEVRSAQVEAIEERIAGKKADIQLAAESAAQQKRDDAFEELQPLREQIADERTAVRKECEGIVKRLDGLEDPVEADRLNVLSETDNAELEERFGLVFKSGMGAEAVLSILKRLDLEHRSVHRTAQDRVEFAFQHAQVDLPDAWLA